MLDTLFRLSIRFKQREQALQGLSKTYTIGGKTARAREFLFGHESLDAKEAAQLEHLRGLLKGNTLEIVPTIVDEHHLPDREQGDARRRAHHACRSTTRGSGRSPGPRSPTSSPWARRTWTSGRRRWT